MVFEIGDVLVPTKASTYHMDAKHGELLFYHDGSLGRVWWVLVENKDGSTVYRSLSTNSLSIYWTHETKGFEMGKWYAVKTAAGAGVNRYYVEDVYSTGDGQQDQYAIMRMEAAGSTDIITVRSFATRDSFIEVAR